jgi:hypothetical protein
MAPPKKVRWVYDVAADDDRRFLQQPPFVLYLVGLGLITLTYTVIKAAGDEPVRWDRLIVAVTLVPSVVLGGYWLLFGRPVMARQRACKRWAAAGECETVEGVVTGFTRRTSYYHRWGPKHGRTAAWVAEYDCRIGGVPFRWPQNRVLQCRAGFQGLFTEPGVPDDVVGEGKWVRVQHREGIVLRIAVEAEPGAA